jgi:hypothetical protein
LDNPLRKNAKQIAMQTLKTFDNYFTAHIWKEKFEASGIHCFLQDENTSSTIPVWNMAIGGIKLNVGDNDAEQALNLLLSFEEEYAASIVCPGCGNKGMDYVARPTPSNVFMEIMTWLFSSYAVATNYVYQCPSCKLESETMPVTENQNDAEYLQ